MINFEFYNILMALFNYYLVVGADSNHIESFLHLLSQTKYHKPIFVNMAKFKTTILTAGKTATGICIPGEIVEALNAGKKPPIKVTLNGYTYRSTVAVMGGKYMVGVNADIRAASGVKGGDILNVEIELDTEERKVELPADFKKALDKNSDAKKFFLTLSYSKQKNHVTLITQARTDETRLKRIDKSIADLIANKK